MNKVSFDNRDGFIWLDGKMVPWNDAKLQYYLMDYIMQVQYYLKAKEHIMVMFAK